MVLISQPCHMQHMCTGDIWKVYGWFFGTFFHTFNLTVSQFLLHTVDVSHAGLSYRQLFSIVVLSMLSIVGWGGAQSFRQVLLPNTTTY